MKITATQYAKALYTTTEGKSEKEIAGLLSNFVKLLAKNKQLKLFSRIVKKFNEIWNQENDTIEAEITSAEKLPETENKKIEKFIREKYKAEKVILKNKVDKEIKGGVIIRIADEVLDGSVANQLKMLKNNLSK